MYRRPDTERTISGSWTNSNSSPTGTLASRVAMQSPPGASFNMSAVEGAVLETFQSDRDSHTSQYQVNLWEHDIKIGKRLGRGSFAQVFQGLWNDTAVAIKVIEYKEGARDAVDPCMEASLTKELTHPNVVITYDYGWTGHEVNSLLSVRPESIVMVILMEYCNLKSLATNIRHTNRFGHQSGTIKWAPIAHTLIDILRGLTYLHDMDIIHGDIKAANVMLKSVHKTVSLVKFTAKLADLGLAQLRGDAVRAGAVGSLTHAAPELLNLRCNTPQSDIYAFGVLMYEIISGKEPFKGLSVTDLIRLKTSTDTADTLVLEAGDDRVCAAFIEIFHQCVASEPADRPTCKDLFKQLRALSTNCGLTSQDSGAHYQAIRVCPDSCGSPRKELFSLGVKAASLASQSSRYSRSPRSTDANGAAQVWASQGQGGYVAEQHAGYAQRRGMHAWGPGGPTSSYNLMRSQLSPRGWRSPTATSPHNSQHGSPARSPYPDQHPFSYDHSRPAMEDTGRFGMGAMHRNHTLGSLSGAMSPTHSEHAVPMDMRRFEQHRGSGSVASSVHDTIRSSAGPSTQTDLAGTYERINSLNARQGAASTQPGVPSPLVAYRQTHVYQTGAPAAMGPAGAGPSSDVGYPASAAVSASNATSSSRMARGVREPGSDHSAVPCGVPGLGSHSRPSSVDKQSDFHRSMSAHQRSSGGLPPGAPQHASPPGSQHLDGSVPASMEYDAVFHNPAAVLAAHDAGDETAPEDGDTSSNDSRCGNSRAHPRAHDNSEMAATQAALGGLDSTDSFADRRQLNLGSVDSFNLEMGNSSNLQRLMRDHNPAGKAAVLADASGGPSGGGPSGTSLALDEDRKRVAGTTIPEASVTEGTLDAMPSVSAIRRAGGSSAGTRRQGALLRPGYRNGQRGMLDSDHSGFGAQEDSSAGVNMLAGHNSGTVSLNLWGCQNSQAHHDSLNHVLASAVAGDTNTSFVTDPETGYPVQSIMESMRHMQSFAGNGSSFMRRPSGPGMEQCGASSELERLTSGAALAQPSDPQPAHSCSSSPVAGAVALAPSAPAGSGQAVRTHQQDGHSMSTLECTTQSSLADAPGWVRPAADENRLVDSDGHLPLRPPASSLHSNPLAQLGTASHHIPKPTTGAQLAAAAGGGLLHAEKSGGSTAPAGIHTDNTNGLSTSSMSFAPLAVGGLGMSGISRPPSPLAGTHTLPHTSRTGSLSQTLSHNSLSSAPHMHTHNVLNKPVRAAGQSIPLLRQELSVASLAQTPPTPGESLSGARMSPETVSPASCPSQQPLTASMLPGGLQSLEPHRALRMDESIQGVHAWLQAVPDPADALAQPASPSSRKSRRSSTHSRRHSSPADQAFTSQRAKRHSASGNTSSGTKDVNLSPRKERLRQRPATAAELSVPSLRVGKEPQHEG